MLDKPFKIALLISLGMHSVILAPWSRLDLRLPKKPQTQIEVTYFKAEELSRVEIRQDIEKIAPTVKAKPIEVKKEEKIVKREPPRVKEAPQPDKTIVSVKKAVPKKSIQIQSTPDLEGNISYLSYSQLVREKIRQYLYRNYREFMGEGDVAVNFILKSNGTLKDLYIIDEFRVSSNRLGQLSVKSIKEASPFRPFPKELDLDEISFKITISFKTD